jgi:hypothetical protein
MAINRSQLCQTCLKGCFKIIGKNGSLRNIGAHRSTSVRRNANLAWLFRLTRCERHSFADFLIAGRKLPEDCH